jgi:hypothetical protein
MGVVIVRFDDSGELSYHAFGETRLFIVDERCPHDRVYEWLPRGPIEELRELIPQDAEIGSNQDDRHQAIAHMVHSYLDGTPHLRAVPHPNRGGEV